MKSASEVYLDVLGFEPSHDFVLKVRTLREPSNHEDEINLFVLGLSLFNQLFNLD